MFKDSVETLLLRCYGNEAPVPAQLETRLITMIQRETQARHQQEQAAAQIRRYRLDRRRAVKLVAMSSAGLGMLSVGLDMVSHTVSGSETAHAILP